MQRRSLSRRRSSSLLRYVYLASCLYCMQGMALPESLDINLYLKRLALLLAQLCPACICH